VERVRARDAENTRGVVLERGVRGERQAGDGHRLLDVGDDESGDESVAQIDLADRRDFRTLSATHGPAGPLTARGAPLARALPLDDADEVRCLERHVDEIECGHDMAGRVGRADGDIGVEPVGQVDALTRERFGEVGRAVGDDGGDQRRMLLMLSVRHELAVEVVKRVPGVVVRIVRLVPETQGRHAHHLERRRVRPARARRVGPGHAPLQLERPLRIECGQGHGDLLEIDQPRFGDHRAGDGAGAAVPVDHHRDPRGDLGALLEPGLRADQADLFGREEDDDDRPLGPAAGRGDQPDRLHHRGKTRPVVDAPGRGAEAVEMAAEDDVFVGEFRPLEGGDHVMVFDRSHFEPVPDVELELDRLALLGQGLDLLVLVLGQLDVGQDRELVPGLDEPVEHRERIGPGGLDRAPGAGLDEGRGELGDELGVGVFGRAAAAVPGEAGALPGDEDPGALEGGEVGLDLGDSRFDGGTFLFDVLGLGVAPRDGERVGLQEDDRSPLDALRSRGEARGAEVQRLLGRLGHLAEPGAAVEADRDLAGLIELGLEPPLLELPDRPGGGVGVGVGAGLTAAEPIAGVIIPDHDPVIRRA
jgi:hypothetical protein